MTDNYRVMLEKSGVEASALPQLYRAIDARARDQRGVLKRQ